MTCNEYYSLKKLKILIFYTLNVENEGLFELKNAVEIVQSMRNKRKTTFIEKANGKIIGTLGERE
jgi:hypothetical protein